MKRPGISFIAVSALPLLTASPAFCQSETEFSGIKSSRGGKQLEEALKKAKEENWIVEFGLKRYFNQKPAREQFRRPGDPRFIGA
tara:strand:+ start:727 stop:981 length:255 start_codon:yes stop_codon:yes gene_type:complete